MSEAATEEKVAEDLQSNADFLKKCKESLKHSAAAIFIIYPIFYTYIYLGAILFLYIEHCWATQPPSPISDTKELLTLICKSLETYNIDNDLNSTSINETIIDLKEVYKKCQTAFQDNDQLECALNENNFFEYVELTLSICFTTGYGVVTPLTDAGKITTMIYALPGIALALTLYMYYGNFLLDTSKIILFCIETKLFSRNGIRYLKRKLFIIHLIMLAHLMLIQAFLSTLAVTENYRFLDSIYFVFITVTTIGFGDFDYKIKNYAKRIDLYIISGICIFCSFGLLASLISILVEAFQESGLSKIPIILVNFISCRRKGQSVGVNTDVNSPNENKSYEKDTFTDEI